MYYTQKKSASIRHTDETPCSMQKEWRGDWRNGENANIYIPCRAEQSLAVQKSRLEYMENRRSLLPQD